MGKRFPGRRKHARPGNFVISGEWGLKKGRERYTIETVLFG